MNERITLNMKEQRINNILIKLLANEINISDVSRLTGLSERQIYRKKKAYLKDGIKSIVISFKVMLSFLYKYAF